MTSVGTDDDDDDGVGAGTKAATPQRQQQQQQHQQQQQQQQPTKSCLSRHNSTHQSIKKKVNISTRAEIIEPEPSPTSLLMLSNHNNNNNNNNSLADDDEVFSDSLPPPKRESMCAPYIEGELLPETLVFAHGLPAWFDDERLNDMYAFSFDLI